MSLEKDLLKTLTNNLNLIEEFRITDDMFHSKLVKSIFEKMVKHKNEGYKLYQPNDYETKQLSTSKFVLVDNIRAIKNKVAIETKKNRLREDVAKMHNFFERGVDFELNDIISKTTSQLSKHNSMESDKKDVFKSTDKEFEEFRDEILKGDFTFVSNIKTEEWKCFDDGMRGLRPNKTTILSANTGIGKTSFSINVARLVSTCKEAVDNNKFVLYINLEMEAKELYHRIICAIGQITLKEFENASKDDSVKDKINKAHEDFAKLNLYLTSDKPKTVNELQYIIDTYNKNDALCLVVIDYIGKIKNRDVELEAEYKKLFGWISYLNERRADYGNYHLWILSQLSREGEKSDNASSRESVQGGYAMLQDVDTVLTLIPSVDGFIIKNEKNRGGRDQWLILFDFMKDIQRFEEKDWTTLKEIKKLKEVEFDF